MSTYVALQWVRMHDGGLYEAVGFGIVYRITLKDGSGKFRSLKSYSVKAGGITIGGARLLRDAKAQAQAYENGRMSQ